MHCLANPRYINCACVAALAVGTASADARCLPHPPHAADLAQHQLLSDPSLVAYLAYLHAHWSRPEYSRCLCHPAALAALELLQSPEFRAAMASPDATEHVWRQLFWSWQFGGQPLWVAQAAPWRGQPLDATARNEAPT